MPGDYEDNVPEKIAKKQKEWEDKTLNPLLSKHPERLEKFITTSSMPIKRIYTPADIKDFDYEEKLGFPSEYPFTRGVQPTMHRGRLWTMRQFAGFGSATETNERYHYLLNHGETGLSVAFDYPTLYGYDTDHPMSEGEFGKCGVSISTLGNMETLFDGIDPTKVTTSMTINGPAPVVWAFYIAMAEGKGAAKNQIGGTIQNDILKEYIAQKSWIFPPAPSMKLIVDTFEYGTKEVPRWNTISISGYHIREAGSTAAQELAFTLADGLEYVRHGVERGLDVDAFAPRLSFFFNAHNDLFEEIAKYRAARRIWAREMKETFGAKNPRSWWLRFHTQTAGCSLTAQQPEINLIRVTIQGLAAVMGGTQSLHTNSMDEALALPSEKAVRLALRTQQIIAHESGVTNTIDPLAGSYAVEALTDEMEDQCYEYFRKIESLGGVLPAIDKGFFQKEIADAAYRYQKEIEDNTRIMVGVNDYCLEEEIEIPILRMDPEGERKQLQHLKDFKTNRDQIKCDRALEGVKRACEEDLNTMPYILEAVKTHATLGEIIGVMKEVFGEYKEPAIF